MESKKRILLLFGCLILFIGIPIVLWIVQNNNTSKQPVITPPIATPTPVPIVKTPDGKVLIDGVKMNDFTKSPVKVDQAKDVFFVNTPEYEIVYLAPFSQFLISIKQTPFEQNRIRAEEDLLRTLDIDTNQACQLDVQITMPGYVDPEFAGRIFPLSFCQ